MFSIEIDISGPDRYVDIDPTFNLDDLLGIAGDLGADASARQDARDLVIEGEFVVVCDGSALAADVVFVDGSVFDPHDPHDPQDLEDMRFFCEILGRLAPAYREPFLSEQLSVEDAVLLCLLTYEEQDGLTWASDAGTEPMGFGFFVSEGDEEVFYKHGDVRRYIIAHELELGFLRSWGAIL